MKNFLGIYIKSRVGDLLESNRERQRFCQNNMVIEAKVDGWSNLLQHFLRLNSCIGTPALCLLHARQEFICYVKKEL